MSGRRRHWELVRALAGIESYAKRRGGPASELVSACVWDLVDGPAGLLFRRADRWGLAFYVANVTTGKLPNALDRRGVWERHFTPEIGEAGGGFLDPLREFRNSARRERSRRLDS